MFVEQHTVLVTLTSEDPYDNQITLEDLRALVAAGERCERVESISLHEGQIVLVGVPPTVQTPPGRLTYVINTAAGVITS